jgi:hypothetical protein
MCEENDSSAVRFVLNSATHFVTNLALRSPVSLLPATSVYSSSVGVKATRSHFNARHSMRIVLGYGTDRYFIVVGKSNYLDFKETEMSRERLTGNQQRLFVMAVGVRRTK